MNQPTQLNKKNKEPCLHSESWANELIPGLWLGNKKSAVDINFLRRENIQYIIRILDNFPAEERVSGINYLYFPIDDENICGADLDRVFNEANSFIKKGLQNKKGILVHCKAGHHRSASLVAAYLIKELNVKYSTAVAYINFLRPCALRRETCMARALFSWVNKNYGSYCPNFECRKTFRFYTCDCKYN